MRNFSHALSMPECNSAWSNLSCATIHGNGLIGNGSVCDIDIKDVNVFNHDRMQPAALAIRENFAFFVLVIVFSYSVILAVVDFCVTRHTDRLNQLAHKLCKLIMEGQIREGEDDQLEDVLIRETRLQVIDPANAANLVLRDGLGYAKPVVVNVQVKGKEQDFEFFHAEAILDWLKQPRRSNSKLVGISIPEVKCSTIVRAWWKEKKFDRNKSGRKLRGTVRLVIAGPDNAFWDVLTMHELSRQPECFTWEDYVAYMNAGDHEFNSRMAAREQSRRPDCFTGEHNVVADAEDGDSGVVRVIMDTVSHAHWAVEAVEHASTFLGSNGSSSIEIPLKTRAVKCDVPWDMVKAIEEHSLDLYGIQLERPRNGHVGAHMWRTPGTSSWNSTADRVATALNQDLEHVPVDPNCALSWVNPYEDHVVASRLAVDFRYWDKWILKSSAGKADCRTEEGEE
ncbi:MAG: hypothetical protein SGPRY_007168, partial [Prymnesium sp.]